MPTQREIFMKIASMLLLVEFSLFMRQNSMTMLLHFNVSEIISRFIFLSIENSAVNGGVFYIQNSYVNLTNSLIRNNIGYYAGVMQLDT